MAFIQGSELLYIICPDIVICDDSWGNAAADLAQAELQYCGQSATIPEFHHCNGSFLEPSTPPE